jgi:hypothetical protein
MLATKEKYCKILSRVVVRAGCTRATASNEGKMTDQDVVKTLHTGALTYQLECTGTTSEDVGALVMTLNVTRGVTRATRQEIASGMFIVMVGINIEYNLQDVLGRINRSAIGWARRNGAAIIDGDGNPLQF